MKRMNKNFKLGLSLSFALLMSLNVYADSPAPNEAYQASSANGMYLIDMKPEAGGWGGYGEGGGTAFRSGLADPKEALWQLGFFSSEVILTNDGKHLITFGPWASNMSDLAISFYQDGKELKSYSIGDLIEDETKLMRTVSHFFWRFPAGPPGFDGLSGDQLTFTLSLIDGGAYVFDVTTGEVLEKKVTPSASSVSFG